MIIDDISYPLSNKNYIELETIKKQIVIGNCDKVERSFVKWSTRLNGNYSKTPAFSITKEGKIYQHFDPQYFSTILGNLQWDQKSIVILLENDGWLVKNSENETYINWIGHIYNKPDEVVVKKWRGYSFWAPYTPEQFVVTLELVDALCEEFNIPKISLPHNTKIDDLDNFTGVLYKSNIEKHFTDLNPAWNFEEFYDKLEKK